LCVTKKAEFSVDDPMANSSRLVLPTMTAPAAASLSTTVASYGGTKFSSIFEEQVVFVPRVHMLSLTAIGMPARGPICPPRARRSSRSAAARSAISGV